MYARILTEPTIRSKRVGHSPEEYLDVIANLTPRELMVARALYRDWPKEGHRNRGDGAREAWKGWQDKAHAEVGVDGADL